MKRFSHTINCGVVNAGKTSITGVMNKVVHPPQHLNVVSLALGNGHYRQKSKKRTSNISQTLITVVIRLLDKDLKIE